MSKGFDYFINSDLSNYVGEWICIADNKVVYHGKDIKEGYKKTKEKYPNKIISVTKVPSETNCIF